MHPVVYQNEKHPPILTYLFPEHFFQELYKQHIIKRLHFKPLHKTTWHPFGLFPCTSIQFKYSCR